MKHFENTIPSLSEIQPTIDEVVELKTYTTKKKIDKLLEIAANLRSQLGIDSSQKDRDHVGRLCTALYKGVKRINSEEGNILLRTQDGKE